MIWALLGCAMPSTHGPHSPQLGPEVLLGGQASLSVDHWRNTATLRVQTFRIQHSALPEDRQGIPMGDCAQIMPQATGSGMVFEDIEVSVLCPGHTLTLTDHHSGSSAWVLDRVPEPGLVCTVAIGAQSAKLPPLPAVPELQIEGRSISWQPSGADEVRLVNLSLEESSGVCRLPDLGGATVPRWMTRGDTTLVTWHSARLTEINKRPMSLSATAGTWLRDGAL